MSTESTITHQGRRYAVELTGRVDIEAPYKLIGERGGEYVLVRNKLTPAFRDHQRPAQLVVHRQRRNPQVTDAMSYVRAYTAPR